MSWLLLLLVATAVGVGADDDDEDSIQVPSRHSFSFPHFITNIRVGQTYDLRMKHDTLVILAVSTVNCEACLAARNNFVRAAKVVRRDNNGTLTSLLAPNTTLGSAIHFAYIDIALEIEEFEYISKQKREHIGAPTIIIFKREYQESLLLPAIQFRVDDSLADTLPHFLGRLMGPLIYRPTIEEDIVRVFTSAASMRSTVGVWMKELPRALMLNLPNERLDLLWFQMPSCDEADPELVSRYNPGRADVVVYHYIGQALNQRHLPAESLMILANVTFNKSLVDDRDKYFDHVMDSMRAPLLHGKRLRPGHEFDYILGNVMTIDDVTPSVCTRKAKKGDRVRGRIEGMLAGSLRIFADTRLSTFTVGRHRGDFPTYINEQGFVGMCEQATRRIGIPAGRHHYDAEDMPPGVNRLETIVFRLQLVEFLSDEL